MITLLKSLILLEKDMSTPSGPTSPSSSSRRYPQIENYHTHTHQNQPIVYPYKPDKKDPPGAYQYHPVWLIIKGFFQSFLCFCNPTAYALGFVAGAAKAGYNWAENGPVQKLASDSEYKDFGGMAFSSPIWSQVAVLTENFAAIAIPVYAKNFFPMPVFEEVAGLSKKDNDYLKREFEARNSNPIANYIATGFIAYHAIITGEEVINQFARWLDVGKPRK